MHVLLPLYLRTWRLTEALTGLFHERWRYQHWLKFYLDWIARDFCAYWLKSMPEALLNSIGVLSSIGKDAPLTNLEWLWPLKIRHSIADWFNINWLLKLKVIPSTWCSPTSSGVNCPTYSQKSPLTWKGFYSPEILGQELHITTARSGSNWMLNQLVLRSTRRAMSWLDVFALDCPPQILSCPCGFTSGHVGYSRWVYNLWLYRRFQFPGYSLRFLLEFFRGTTGPSGTFPCS